MKRKCNNCVYRDNCKETIPCEDFYPVDDDYPTDRMVERMIEDSRSEYEDAWRSYINEFAH